MARSCNTSPNRERVEVHKPEARASGSSQARSASKWKHTSPKRQREEARDIKNPFACVSGLWRRGEEKSGAPARGGDKVPLRGNTATREGAKRSRSEQDDAGGPGELRRRTELRLGVRHMGAEVWTGGAA